MQTIIENINKFLNDKYTNTGLLCTKIIDSDKCNLYCTKCNANISVSMKSLSEGVKPNCTGCDLKNNANNITQSVLYLYNLFTK